MNTEIRNYIARAVGDDFLEPFETWAFGEKIKEPKLGYYLAAWNLQHANDQITKAKNTFDAVDRMVAIWKERFGDHPWPKQVDFGD